MLFAAGAITCVVEIMILATGTIMGVVMVFAAVVLLRGNFSVGAFPMGTLHEKLLRGNFPYGHPP